jgi:hypothetical protein
MIKAKIKKTIRVFSQARSLDYSLGVAYRQDRVLTDRLSSQKLWYKYCKSKQALISYAKLGVRN